jgi:tetratricopeptide (TPR) repeat protein
VQKTKSVNSKHEKELLAAAKRYMSFFRQANAAFRAGKAQRREQLVHEMLKAASRFKQMQLELAPDNDSLCRLADECLETATKEVSEIALNSPLLEAISAKDKGPDYLKKAIALMEQSPESDYSSLFRHYDALCEVYSEAKDLVNYEDVCRRALALKEKQVGQWNPAIVSHLLDLAWVLEEQDKYSECAAIRKEALGIFQNDPNADQTDVIALKHSTSYATLLSEGVNQLEAVQKALAMLTPEERKKFSGSIAAELEELV